MKSAPIIRWRLLIGAICLFAALAVTLPAAAAKADVGSRIAEIWPNGIMSGDDPVQAGQLMEIWPNMFVNASLDSVPGASD